MRCTNATSAGNNANSTTGAATTGNSADAASFSAIVDGTPFSANTGTDNLNAAFRVKDDKGIRLFFMLTNPENPVQKFNFDLPDHIGSTTVSILPKESFEGYINKDMVVYLSDGVTINLTSMSATRISGTFSGRYKLENEKTANAKPSIQVTDGKFNIPFSTSASWKKMYHAQ